MSPPPPSFIIAGTHNVYSYGLLNLLKAHFAGCSVAQVSDESRLLLAIQQQPYDVVLIDAGLPPVNGFEAARNLIQLHADCRLLIYANNHREDLLVETFAAGATAFFYSNEPPHEIIYKVNEMLKNGCCILHNNVTAYRAAQQRMLMKNNVKPLTLREKEVLQYIEQGLKNKEIAAAMHRAVSTIVNHRHKIMAKSGKHNTVQLLAYAKAVGWI